MKFDMVQVRLTDEEARTVFKLYEKFNSYAVVASTMQIGETTVRNIVHGKTHKEATKQLREERGRIAEEYLKKIRNKKS